MKTAFVPPNRPSLPLLLLAASFFLGIALLACSSGSGDGDLRTEDLPPVVFMADKDTAGTVELYASFNAGSDIKKLSGLMAFGGNVVDFAVSPFGSHVAYVADQITDGVYELFVSQVDGSAPPAAPVSGAMAGSGIVAKTSSPNRCSFAWSPDSERIAYRAAQSRTDAIELYTVRPDGAENRKLHADFAAGRSTTAFSWAPNASRVAYTANQFEISVQELYTSRPDGSDNRRVSGDLTSGGNVDNFLWSPNSAWIAYRADQNTDGQFELFAARPNRVDVVQVSLPLTSSGDVRDDFAWAPNSLRLAYRTDYVEKVLYRNNKLGLYTSKADGTGQIRVSGGIQPADAIGVAAFQWAPDSERLSYVADQIRQDQFDLFVTTPDTATPLPLKLSQFPVTVDGGKVAASDWSTDSQRIAFIADQNLPGQAELFSSFRTGIGLPQLVSNPGIEESGVEDFAWSPDSSLIAFRADLDADAVVELYTAPPSGSVNYRISTVAATGGQIKQYVWEPGGSGLGFIADQDAKGRFELYFSLPDGSDTQKVSGPLVPGGAVRRFAWVP